ncbi:MAG: DMT family transporter [Rhodospirillaceae bacterium]|nr:DMT family transporter [Rhodospirillaceae bacterium]
MSAAPPRALADSRIGLALLAGLTFFWGINWPIMKIALTEIPVFGFRAMTVIGGASGLLLMARLTGQRLALSRAELKPLIIVSIVNVTGWQILSAFGLVHMEAGRASIVAYTMPVWTALLAVPFLGERLTFRVIAALILGMGGVACLLIPVREGLATAPLGLLFMALAGFVWAAGTISLKRVRWSLSILPLAGWQLLIGGLPVLACAFLLERDFEWSTISTSAWVAAVYAMLIPTVFCQWAWYRVVSIYPASISTLGTLLTPVAGVISSTLMLGEPIGWDVIAALVLVCLAIALITIVPARRA